MSGPGPFLPGACLALHVAAFLATVGSAGAHFPQQRVRRQPPDQHDHHHHDHHDHDHDDHHHHHYETPKPSKPNSERALVEFSTASLHVPEGVEGGSVSVEVQVPIKPGERRLTTGDDVLGEVGQAWDSMVAGNQAGLIDPKEHASLQKQPLSTQEAWHHYRAGLHGVVDSARFLATFSMIPSIQSGGSRLFLAAAMGNAELIDRLLEEGEDDPNEQKISDGSAPLHAAATMCQAGAAASLLRGGANPHLSAKSGATPLMMAATVGCDAVLTTLLDFQKASAGGNTSDPNYKSFIDQPHPYVGTTAMHFAAEMGRGGTIKTLCSYGGDINVKNTKTGGTPLHTAADTNQTGSVEAILGHCMEMQEADEARRAKVLRVYVTKLMMGDTTAVYLAAQRGFTEVVRVLARFGAPLDFAMPRGGYRNEVVTTQQNGMEDPDASGFYDEKNLEVGNGATALHAAAENGHPETVLALCELGARQLPVMESVSPLLLALQYKQKDIALHLVHHLTQRDVDAGYHSKLTRKLITPYDGATPLFIAAGFGYIEVCAALFVEHPGYALDMLHHKTLKTLEGSGEPVSEAQANSVPPFVDALTFALLRGHADIAFYFLKKDTKGLVSGVNRAAGDAFDDEEREVSPKIVGDTYLASALESGSMQCLELMLSILTGSHAFTREHSAAGSSADEVGSKTKKDTSSPWKLGSFDIDTPLFKGETNLLQRALRRRSPPEMIRLLVERYGASLSTKVKSLQANTIHLAVGAGNPHVLAYFVSRVLQSPEKQLRKMLREPAGRRLQWATPLHLACQEGRQDLADILLKTEEGVASIGTALHKTKLTPLFVAAEGGHSKTAALLLSKGANAKVVNAKKQNILHVARDADLARAVVAQDSTLPAGVDASGATPLMSVLLDARGRETRKSAAEFQALLKYLAPLSDVRHARGDKGEFTITHAALEGGASIGAIQYLLKLGAPVGKKTDTIPTPLMMAAEKHRSDVVGVLLKAGDSTANHNSTALHSAARHGPPVGQDCVVCKLLIKSGLDISTPDVAGKRVDLQIQRMMKTGGRQGGGAGGSEACDPADAQCGVGGGEGAAKRHPNPRKEAFKLKKQKSGGAEESPAGEGGDDDDGIEEVSIDEL